MELIEETIEARESGTSFDGDLGRSAIEAVDNFEKQSDKEAQRKEIAIGSLVKLKLIEQDREVLVFISQHERNTNQLSPEIQELLPEGVTVHPLISKIPDNNKKNSASLAERLEHRNVGETIELVNHKHALVLEFTQLDI